MTRLYNRNVLLAAVLAGLAMTAPPAWAEDSALTVAFPRLQSAKGFVDISLFDSADAYRKSRPIRSAKVAATARTISFAALPPGRYLIAAFHDENSDGKLNTGAFGRPTEPYAFSNGAKGRFGPASWDDASFAVGPGASTQVLDLP